MPQPLATSAEVLQTTAWQTAEYALSLRRLRAVGHIVLDGLVEVDTAPDTQQLRAEFDTSLSEMLKTDKEFGKLLQITRFDTHKVVDGTVMTAGGDSVTEALERGYELSQELASSDKRMQTQANRDGQDLINAQEVESMVRGRRDYNTRIVASLMPEEAIEQDGEDYWRGMGYFPETKTAFLQMYHLTEDGELLTGTLSVDGTDKTTMRQLWRDAGVEIPDGEVTDNWLQYAITANLTDVQAKQLVLGLRQKHYEQTGYMPKNATSVEQVLKLNKATVDQAFSQLHLSLAESLASGAKSHDVKMLLDGFMSKASQLGSDIRRALLRTQNRHTFDEADARLAYKLVMYATAEQIRSSMKPTTSNKTQQLPRIVVRNQLHGTLPPQAFVQQITVSALEGVSQRRSYGSCGARIELSNWLVDSPDRALLRLSNPQDIFGGMIEPVKESNDDDAGDGLGPLEFKCTEGHDNVREKGELLTKCKEDDCKGSVGCK